MSDEVQAPVTYNKLMAEPAPKGFIADNSREVQLSIQLGMGLTVFDPGLGTRLMEAVMSGNLKLWRLFFSEDDANQVAGTLSFFIGTDALLGTKFLWIYSLHLSMNVPMEAWRPAFEALAEYAKSEGVTSIAAKTQLPHVADIARDNGFAVGTYLERGL